MLKSWQIAVLLLLLAASEIHGQTGITIPSSASALKAVQTALEAWGAGDVDGFLRCLSKDVEFTKYADPDAVPFGGTYKGHEQVRELITQRFATFTMEDFQVKSMNGLTDQHHNSGWVLVSIDLAGKVVDTRRRFQTRVMDLFHVSKHGLITSIQTWLDSWTIAQAYKRESGLKSNSGLLARSANAQIVNSVVISINAQAMLSKVQQVYDNFEKGDLTSALKDFDDQFEIEFVADPSAIFLGGVHSGFEEVQKVFEQFGTVFNATTFNNVQYFVDSSQGIVAVGHVWGETVLATKRSFASHAMDVWYFNSEGRLQSCDAFMDSYVVAAALHNEFSMAAE